MTGLELIDRAKRFAAAAHVMQSYGDGAPFIKHPAAVAGVVRDWRYGSEWIAAAWLHDVVEDTPVTVAQVAERFGDRVALIVAHLTLYGTTREERLYDAMAKVAAYPRAAPVRLADRLCNVRACVPGDRWAVRYLAEAETFEGTMRPLVPPACWTEYRLALGRLDPAVNAV